MASPVSAIQTAKIGILAKRGKSQCLKLWNPIAVYLDVTVPEAHFSIVPLGFDEVIPAAKKRSVDFMLVNPYYYVVLEDLYGAQAIATLRERLPDGNVTTTFGGVVFRRADRTDIPPFYRLKNIRFCAASPNALGGWLAVREELKHCGIEPKRDFKSIQFVGTHDAVVFAIRDGKADVGSVRTTTLQRMAKEGKIRSKDFRIIHLTKRFPNWPFIRLKHTPEKLAQKVTIALLEMSPDNRFARASQCAGWDIHFDYRSVRECLKTLKIPPFNHPISIYRLIITYWHFLLIITILFGFVLIGLFIAIHHNHVIKRQRDEILREIEARTEAIVKYQESEKRFKDLVFTMGDWVWETDTEGHYTYCSEAVSSIVGYSPEELIGKTPFDLLVPGEKERVKNIFEKAAATKGALQDIECLCLTKSGQRVYLLTNGVPILDKEGNLKGFRGVEKDVTPQKQAQERLLKVHDCLSGLGTNFEENIKKLVKTASDILGACCAFFHEWKEGKLRTLYAYQAPPGFGTDPPKGSVCYHALQQTRGSVFITDLQNSEFVESDPLIAALGLQTYVGQPIYMEGKQRGVLCAFLKKQEIPPQDAVNLLNVLGEAISKEIERHLFSHELYQRETFLRTLIESAIDAIIVMDLDRQIVDVNQAFQKIFGYHRNEILGQSIALLHLSKEKSEAFRKIAYPIIQKNGYWQGEWELKKKDGTVIPIETVTAALKEKGKGEIKGFVAFVRDISERKRAEEALIKTHSRLSQIINAIHSILIGVSSKGTITLWNKVAEATLGCEERKVIGTSITTCGITWEWQKIERGLMKCKTTEKVVSVGDVYYTSPEGKKKILGMTINPVLNPEGNLVGMLILAADITEKRLMEAQLLQAQKMESIGQLAAGIAHEVNTPTQFIGDNLTFLKDAFTDIAQLLEKYQALLAQVKKSDTALDLTEDLEAFLEEIEIDYLLEEIPKTLDQSLEGVRRVSKIVLAMKEFSHPGIKEKVMVDLNKAIETTLTVTRNVWKYVADVKTDLDPHLPEILCMPDEINQVILNLIVNAAQAIEEAVDKASGEKGKITISTREGAEWIEIRIQDTGVGIPPEIQNRIFDPFFTTKEVGKGTGQGLAIVHDTVVNKHAGQIFFETEVGKGTTFIVRLPKIKSEEG